MTDFTRLVVNQFGGIVVLFGPTQIHTQQHLGPVLRLRAARARMNRQKSVALSVLATEQRLRLDLRQLRFQPAYLLSDVLSNILAFGAELEERL